MQLMATLSCTWEELDHRPVTSASRHTFIFATTEGTFVLIFDIRRF